MSLLVTAALWFSLAIAVGVAGAIAFGIGMLYGRIARGRDDESAARGMNVVALGTAIVAGLPVWIAVDAGATAGSTVADDEIAAAVLAAVASGLAAGIVGTGAVSGVVRARPGLPGVDEPSLVRRRYFRYLAVVFASVVLLVGLLQPAIQAGTLAFVGVVLVVGLAFWAAGPFLRSMTISTRRPTDAERERLERLLEAVDFEPRGIRIVEGGDQYATVAVHGAPGGRVLFVGAKVLSALEDDALLGVVAAQREQTAHYERLVSMVAFLVAVTPLVAGVTGELPLLVGAAVTAPLVLAAFAVSRRLRWRADARAADRVGAAELADAFEAIAAAAGFDLEDEDEGGRNWFATNPPLAARIARLRADADARAGTDEQHG